MWGWFNGNGIQFIENFKQKTFQMVRLSNYVLLEKQIFLVSSCNLLLPKEIGEYWFTLEFLGVLICWSKVPAFLKDAWKRWGSGVEVVILFWMKISMKISFLSKMAFCRSWTFWGVFLIIFSPNKMGKQNYYYQK